MNRPDLFQFVVLLLCLSQVSFASPQSLADAARKEAERRKALEQQGIGAKVVSGESAREMERSKRAVPEPRLPPGESAGRAGVTRSQVSLRSFRTTLQKLDLDIRHGEERLSILRARLEAEKWRLPKVGKLSRGGAGTSAYERLRIQIEELETKMKGWRRERYETYEAGRKAGYLPGERDGKGIVP